MKSRYLRGKDFKEENVWRGRKWSWGTKCKPAGLEIASQGRAGQKVSKCPRGHGFRKQWWCVLCVPRSLASCPTLNSTLFQSGMLSSLKSLNENL